MMQHRDGWVMSSWRRKKPLNKSDLIYSMVSRLMMRKKTATTTTKKSLSMLNFTTSQQCSRRMKNSINKNHHKSHFAFNTPTASLQWQQIKRRPQKMLKNFISISTQHLGKLQNCAHCHELADTYLVGVWSNTREKNKLYLIVFKRNLY